MPGFAFRLRSSLTLLTMLFLVAACSTNPVTGKREILLMSPEQEKALGAQAAEQVEQSIGLVEDPQLTAYIEAIGNRLAEDSPRQDVEYRFYVANMEEPNAFALPGGYIYLSRGLLALSNSEAEIANVLGHEIGHVAARHSAQRQTAATGLGVLTVLGTIFAANQGGAQAAQQAQQLGNVLGSGLIATYGRDQERQSDEIGQDLAADNGWNPLGMRDFMAQLGNYTVYKTGEKRQPTWFDSHPTTDERVETAQQRAQQLTTAPIPNIADSTFEYYQQLEGLLVGADPSGGVFRDGLFLHPTLNFAFSLPEPWDKANQPTAVLAAPQSRDAMVRLEGQGATGDPVAAAREFAQQNQLQLGRSASGSINGFNAFQAVAQAQTDQGPLGLHLTWIAHPQMMVRITGMAPLNAFNNYARTFDSIADSFRGLTQAEAGSFTELRLNVATARNGETLSQLSQRVGNAWSVEETKVANGLPSELLSQGQPVKVAIEVPFRP
ncbi:MAG: M48 family metalloprotease [Gammaproteobacteria bacterium]|nr:M48 family metalloprotease [Gammaproteobacteria bacterium]